MTVNIKAYENGPIVIEGRLAVRNNGAPAPAESTALCRCGSSAKGLFCDGTHTRVGFRAEGFALEAASEEAAPEDAS